LVARRVAGWAAFEAARRRDRRRCELIGRERVGGRTVEIYVSLGFLGAPFTGGVLRPYVCLPATTLADLSADEQAAALAHELQHVRTLDVLQGALIELLGDLFWFLPFYGTLGRKLERL